VLVVVVVVERVLVTVVEVVHVVTVLHGLVVVVLLADRVTPGAPAADGPAPRRTGGSWRRRHGPPVRR